MSDLARVRSVDRIVTHKNGRSFRLRGRVLRTYVAVAYEQLRLGRGNPVYVHELVAKAFLGPRPVGAEVRHLDGNSGDSTALNLGWGTHSENQFDQVEHGTHARAGQLRCEHGHLLIEPNLAKGRRRELGWRGCLACNRATSAVRRASRDGRVLDLRAEADRRYERIMATVDAFDVCPDCGATGTRRGPFKNAASLGIHRGRAHGYAA